MRAISVRLTSKREQQNRELRPIGDDILLYVLSCRIWSFCVEECSINTEEPQNWRALKLRTLGMGGVADPKIHAPPRHVLPRQTS